MLAEFHPLYLAGPYVDDMLGLTGLKSSEFSVKGHWTLFIKLKATMECHCGFYDLVSATYRRTLWHCRAQPLHSLCAP